MGSKSSLDMLSDINSLSTFYGMILDEDQKVAVNCMLDPNNLIVFIDSVAGTGKTTLAAGAANILCHYNLYEGIVYICAPTQEEKQGYLPGDIKEKSELYFEPFYQALEEINVNKNTALNNNIINQKNGTAYIECMPHTYLRGTNFKNKVIIIDEAQNFYGDELRKVLTRCHDSCKVIVIGHTGQIDLYKNRERSGFAKYIDLFSKYPNIASICKLTKNYRGLISTIADSIDLGIESA